MKPYHMMSYTEQAEKFRGMAAEVDIDTELIDALVEYIKKSGIEAAEEAFDLAVAAREAMNETIENKGAEL